MIDALYLSKLKWRCRRGLLENDLLIERFFERQGTCLTFGQAQGLMALMELPDPDLLDLLLARKEPESELRNDDVLDVLRLIRSAPAHSPSL